ncbi:MAG: ankyrin repeat domain-containing protein [Xanthomonadales bacterium]|nr:ankyrin repeat domain-containing protein [Xanthomonadales bacterium]
MSMTTTGPADGGATPERPPDSRLPALLVALAAVTAAATLPLLPHWLSPLGWLLMQPVLAGATLGLNGRQAIPDNGGLRATLPPFLGLFLLHTALLLMLAALPLQQLLQDGGLGWALLLGAALTAAWLLLWPRWPLLLLPWLADDHGRVVADAGWSGLRLRARRLAGAASTLSGSRSAELPYSGLLPAAVMLVLLALGPLLWLFSVRPLPWFGGALLAAVCYQRLFARLCGVRRAAPAAARPTPTPVPVTQPVTAEADATSALYDALRQARPDDALACIEQGADLLAIPGPDQTDQRTLLMLSTLLSDLRPMRQLIARGVPVDAVHGGLTALLVATRDSYQGRVEAVMTLLANGADPRDADSEGNTPLHHAARSSDPGVAALLLDGGADVDASNGSGLTPLGMACSCSNWRLARFLLENAASASPDGCHPPLLAAASGDDDPTGVRLLLRHKAGVNATGRFGRTALHAAALSGNADVAAMLIEAGADLDARDERGIAALHEAARAGADPVIEQLAAAGADAMVLDEAGCNALNIACRSRRATVATLRALLRMGVDPEHVGSDGRTPLEQVLATGRWALVATLDPSYQLPASVMLDDDEADALLPLPDRLLRLLRERRFDDAGAAIDRESLPSEQAFTLGMALATGEHGLAGLRWLQRHGLIDEAWRDIGGSTFAFALLGQGHAAAGALQALLAQNLSVSGAGGLARYLHATLQAEHSSRAAEALALLLVDHGADVHGRHGDQEPVLIQSLRQGWLRLLERLLLMGVDPEQRDRTGNTALQLACCIGLEPAVRLLIRHGASPEARSADGQTAQGVALASGRRELSRWLSWSRWRPARRSLQPADLCAAAAVGDRDAVERLLDLGLPLNAVDAQGCSALLRAAGSGRLDVVDLLLARGADPALPALTGATALSAAVSMGHAAVVSTLIDGGARIDQALPGGVTPLMVAAALGHADLVDRLLSAGADIGRSDDAGNAALLAAAQYVAAHGRSSDGADLLQRLLNAGADVDAINRSGQSVLLLLLGARLDAGTRVDEDAVLAALERLLGFGVDLSVQDRRGYGPLHLAALHGLSRVVTRLLSAGARPALRDTLGRSAHDIAVMRGFVDIAQLFEPRAQPALARYLRPDGSQGD